METTRARKAGPRQLPWLKPGVFAGALVPLAMLLARLATKTLGADPIAIALNQLGLLALILLFASLATTPARIVFGWSWPPRLRRMLGLFAFFYASLHLLTYAIVDQGLAWAAIGRDIAERPFIMAGLSAFVLLVPLAATSTAGMQKRLGGVRWRRLHRLVYLAAIAASVHFIWRVKRDLSQPEAYAWALAALLAVRIVSRLRRRSPLRT